MDILYVFTFVLIIVLCALTFVIVTERRDARKERLEEERIRNCTHKSGYTVLKIFGHPDFRECNECGRVFGMSGEEVSRKYLKHLEDKSVELFRNSERKQICLSLPFESFKKLYILSVERKMTMDDMIVEMIDNFKIEYHEGNREV